MIGDQFGAEPSEAQKQYIAQQQAMVDQFAKNQKTRDEALSALQAKKDDADASLEDARAAFEAAQAKVTEANNAATAETVQELKSKKLQLAESLRQDAERSRQTADSARILAEQADQAVQRMEQMNQEQIKQEQQRLADLINQAEIAGNQEFVEHYRQQYEFLRMSKEQVRQASEYAKTVAEQTSQYADQVEREAESAERTAQSPEQLQQIIATNNQRLEDAQKQADEAADAFLKAQTDLKQAQLLLDVGERLYQAAAEGLIKPNVSASLGNSVTIDTAGASEAVSADQFFDNTGESEKYPATGAEGTGSEETTEPTDPTEPVDGNGAALVIEGVGEPISVDATDFYQFEDKVPEDAPHAEVTPMMPDETESKSKDFEVENVPTDAPHLEIKVPDESTPELPTDRTNIPTEEAHILR